MFGEKIMKIVILPVLGVVIGLLAISSAQALDPLSSPAIDASIYKEGYVRQFEKQFESWTARCEEIVQLRHRVCNLLAGAYDDHGERRGTILLATDEAGRPTFMIAIKLPVRVSIPIEVETAFRTKAKKKFVQMDYRDAFSAILCDTTCKYMFTADQRLVFSLNEGNVVKIVFHGVGRRDGLVLAHGESDAVELAVHGEGFAQALQACLATWPSPQTPDAR
jgi:hypothetical protein